VVDTWRPPDLIGKMIEEQRTRQAKGGTLQSIKQTPEWMRLFASNLGVGMGKYETETPFTKSLAAREAGLTFGGARRVLEMPVHSLAYVKAMKKAAGVSLLAVLLSVFTGAIRRYCDAQDPEFAAVVEAEEASGQLRSRAQIPTPVPSGADSDPAEMLCNSFAIVSCNLALASKTPQERLEETVKSLTALKPSAMAVVSAWQEEYLLGSLPLTQRQHECLKFSSMHSMDFSNVPGPQDAGFIAGNRVEGISVCLPNMLPQVILLSYAGAIHPTMTYDPELITAPQVFAEAYLDELRALGEALEIRGDPIKAENVEDCLPLSEQTQVDAESQSDSLASMTMPEEHVDVPEPQQQSMRDTFLAGIMSLFGVCGERPRATQQYMSGRNIRSVPSPQTP